MAEAYLGEIRMFGFTFAPKGWADCNGQIMQIQTNQALYALLGINFGGNGSSTFGLPNLQGRIPLHYGPVNNQIGATGGVESVTLTNTQMPAHTHSVTCSKDTAGQWTPQGNVPAVQVSGRDPVNQYATGGSVPMTPMAVAGGSQPHSNMPPYQVIRFCICLSGIFPSRN